MKYFILAGILFLSGCTSGDSSRRALDGAGFTDIKIEGYAWFACSKDDVFATRFTAKGPTGKQVSGAVCAGLFKGSTIRLD